MPRRIVFKGAKQVALEGYEQRQPRDGEAMVRARFSLMSTGTENIVLNRLFEPGGHWDKWVQYPFYPGYSVVGEVTQVGGGVAGLKAGDHVALRGPHASLHVVAAEKCYPIPAGIDHRLAAWFALAKIAYMGARAADYRTGQSVLIIGAGPIGQMSTRWARAAGVEPIIVADVFQSRLALARHGGATVAIAKPVAEAEAEILSANSGQLPDVVLDGTGNAEVFAAALKLARRFGRVVLLGDTGMPTQQRLTPDVVVRGLTIVGAHDIHSEGDWPESRIVRLFFNLAADGRFDLQGMNTHEFPPEDCPAAYELANGSRGQTMGILFDWTKG